MGIRTPVSLSEQIKQKTLVESAKEYLFGYDGTSGRQEILKQYCSNSDFKNVKPAIGYIDETKYPIYGTYNMSFSSANNFPDWAISDATGREIVYTRASSDAYTQMKVYRAYRFNETTDFTFENSPVQAAYFTEDQYIERILGLGCEWMACVVNTPGSASQIHLIYTDGNSPQYWNRYINITSIAAIDSTTRVLVFKEQQKIGVYKWNGTKRILHVYDPVTLNEIGTPIELLDTAGVLDFPESENSILISSHNHFGPECVTYNDLTRELVIVANMEITTKDSLNRSNGWYRYHIGNTFTLKAGLSVEIESQLFNQETDYIHNNYNKMYCSGTYCASTMTYDDYQRIYRIVKKSWDASEQNIYKMNATKKKVSSYQFENHQKTIRFFTADSCPWAKGYARSAFFMNGRLFSCGRESKKYGSIEFSSDYFKSYGANRCLNLKPGKWYAVPQIAGQKQANGVSVDPSTINMEKTGMNMLYTYCPYSWGKNNIAEFIFTDAEKDGTYYSMGKKEISPRIAAIIPSLPAPYSAVSIYVGYCKKLNKIWGFAAKPAPPDDPDDPNAPDNWEVVLIGYNIEDESFEEHAIENATFTGIINAMKINFDYSKRYGNIYSHSNWFFDDDGYGYVEVKVDHAQGTAATTSFKIAPDGTNSVWRGVGLWYWRKCIGYDNTFGYYITDSSDGYNSNVIFHTKNIETDDELMTLEEFRNQSISMPTHTRLGLQSASGLIAYTQDIPVLISGKCRVIASTGIELFPSCTNYIFVIGRFNQFQIDVRKSKTLNEGESVFNTLLVAEIDTNEADPIDTRYYNIIL